MKIVQPKVIPLQEINGTEILKHIEKIARTCYKSEGNIKEGSAEKLVKSLCNAGHWAMIEHFSISMRYIGSIAAYKDLTRSRIASYAIESTRWCNYSKGKFNGEIKFLDPVEIKKNTKEYEIWKRTLAMIEKNYMEMAKLGASADQLSLLLPQSTAAEFNITANLREWNHIFELRALGHSRPSVKSLMQTTLELFHDTIPVIYDNVYEKMVAENKQNRR